MTEGFVVNRFLSLRLENGKTIVYINGNKFIQCKYLLIDIPLHHTETITNFSTDNLFNSENELDYHEYSFKLSPKLEFWGHCSNLQVWYENDYDTRLLHTNIAFPLLKKLTEGGDPLARKTLKEEIALRVISGNPNVVLFLFEEGYLENFSPEELQTILEDINIAQIFDQNLELLFLLLNKLGKRDLKELSAIKWLSKLKDVKDLTIESKKLTTLDCLENFTNLEYLNLNDNEFIEIRGLNTLENLKKLNLNRNKIVNMKGLKNLMQLKELYLWNNQIKEISGLENLTKLEKLSLGGNQIREIRGLKSLRKLVFLDLSYNQLTKLEGLTDLQNLQVLYLHSNKLTEINEIFNIPKLKEVKLENNSFSEELKENLRNLNLNIISL